MKRKILSRLNVEMDNSGQQPVTANTERSLSTVGDTQLSTLSAPSCSHTSSSRHLQSGAEPERKTRRTVARGKKAKSPGQSLSPRQQTAANEKSPNSAADATGRLVDEGGKYSQQELSSISVKRATTKRNNKQRLRSRSRQKVKNTVKRLSVTHSDTLTPGY